MQNVLSDISVIRSDPTEIDQENLGGIYWTVQVQWIRNVKHVEVKYHFVSDSVEKKHLEISYTPPSENPSDPFKTALIGEQFKRLRTEVNVKAIDAPKEFSRKRARQKDSKEQKDTLFSMKN